MLRSRLTLSPGLQQPEIGLVERLADGGDGVGVILLLHHREADAVVRYALVDLQLMGERAPHRYVYVVPVLFYPHYRRGFLNYSRKHVVNGLFRAKILNVISIGRRFITGDGVPDG